MEYGGREGFICLIFLYVQSTEVQPGIEYVPLVCNGSWVSDQVSIKYPCLPDRGDWQATSIGLRRSGHNLVTKQEQMVGGAVYTVLMSFFASILQCNYHSFVKILDI